MGDIKTPPKAKLICGMISLKEVSFEIASSKLRVEFGPIDYQSQILPFNHTDYYEAEMGKDLARRFISFKRLIAKEDLIEIKLLTNTLEKELSRVGRRQINLDPGYLTLDKLVLATTKDYTHRIYLGKGIYGEVTLYYRDGAWHPFEWTYPDYRTSEYIAIFEEIRINCRRQMREDRI